MEALTEERPTLATLISRHDLTAIALADAARVDPGMIVSVSAGMRTHAVSAQYIVAGINKLANQHYTINDINPQSYYGSASSVDLFAQEGVQ